MSLPSLPPPVIIVPSFNAQMENTDPSCTFRATLVMLFVPVRVGNGKNRKHKKKLKIKNTIKLSIFYDSIITLFLYPTQVRSAIRVFLPSTPNQFLVYTTHSNIFSNNYHSDFVFGLRLSRFLPLLFHPCFLATSSLFLFSTRLKTVLCIFISNSIRPPSHTTYPSPWRFLFLQFSFLLPILSYSMSNTLGFTPCRILLPRQWIHYTYFMHLDNRVTHRVPI